MGLLENISIPRRQCHLLFLIGASESMAGSKIGSINDAIENVLPMIREISEDNPDFQNQNNFNAFPHEGIFHPEPNIFICKTDCCYKYMGLFIILYGSISGVVMIIIGIIFKIIPY